MRDRAPAYQVPVLHFDPLRLVALREGNGTEETFATENEKKCTCARKTSPRSCLLEHSLQPALSPLCELA